MRYFRLWTAVFAAGLMALPTAASAADPVNGTDYMTLSRPVPTEGAPKVEVIEFFWYACPHCRVFEPPLKQWVKQQGGAIAFRRVPVAFGLTPEQRQRFVPQQKLYYTLEAMGKLESLHEAVFRAIHDSGQPLDTDAAIFQFAEKQGLDVNAFKNLYESFGVQSKLERALQLQQAYRIDRVPVVVVGGRYVTAPSLIGASLGRQSGMVLETRTLQVMSWLVAQLARETPAPSAPAN
jgi:protein dithiol oxidoreductase (disulfide-forming)